MANYPLLKRDLTEIKRRKMCAIWIEIDATESEENSMMRRPSSTSWPLQMFKKR